MQIVVWWVQRRQVNAIGQCDFAFANQTGLGLHQNSALKQIDDDQPSDFRRSTAQVRDLERIGILWYW